MKPLLNQAKRKGNGGQQIGDFSGTRNSAKLLLIQLTLRLAKFWSFFEMMWTEGPNVETSDTTTRLQICLDRLRLSQISILVSGPHCLAYEFV